MCGYIICACVRVRECLPDMRVCIGAQDVFIVQPAHTTYTFMLCLAHTLLRQHTSNVSKKNGTDSFPASCTQTHRHAHTHTHSAVEREVYSPETKGPDADIHKNHAIRAVCSCTHVCAHLHGPLAVMACAYTMQNTRTRFGQVILVF